MQTIPKGAQNFWELIVELWVGVSEQTMGRRRGRRFMPLVATAFLFILFSNWFGTLPIGYITIDVVSNCTNRFPNDPLYYTQDLLFDNALIGDYQQIGPVPAGTRISPNCNQSLP